MSPVVQTAEEKTATGSTPAAVLGLRIAGACADLRPESISGEVIEKVKICLLDLIGCALEARELPWSRQARAIVQPIANHAHGACIIADSNVASCADAAFVNAVMAHGLVREDMHSGSVSHLGIVVLPTLLALSQYHPVTGRRFCAAAVAGYEVGARIGRAAMTPEIARVHRPTGISGPIGASAAGAYLLGLNLDAMTSAISLGANTTLGFNQWAHTGGSEMFFQAGFAARNAVSAALLAEAGAFASPSALDGEAGLLASLNRRARASTITMFDGTPEIMHVYHKPVPACNFAQTPSQAALAIAGKAQVSPDKITSIRVRVPRAGMLYPGCNHAGPFDHVLQAKMSIQYNVAAALIKGSVTEENFTLLEDSTLHRLISVMTLQVDEAMTRAYPAQQGGEVEILDGDGEAYGVRLDDVVNASACEVRERFRAQAQETFGNVRALEIEDCINKIDQAENAGMLPQLLGIDAISIKQ